MVLIIERKAGERINLVFIPKKEFERFYLEHVQRVSNTELTILVKFNLALRDWAAEPTYKETLALFTFSVKEQKIRTKHGLTRDYPLRIHRKFHDEFKVRRYHPYAGYSTSASDGKFLVTIQRDTHNHYLLDDSERLEIQQSISLARTKAAEPPLLYMVTHIGLSS